MFDLIGFWVALTVAIIPPLLIVNLVILFCLSIYLEQITDGEFDTSKLTKICPSVLWMEYIESIDGGWETINVVTLIATHVVGFVLILIVGGWYIDGTLIQKYSFFAEKSAPLFAWAFILIGGYALAVYSGKFIYKLGKRVSKLSQAINTHISDKDAHK